MNLKTWILALVLGVSFVCYADESGEPKIGKQNRTLADVYDLGRPRPKLSYGSEVLRPKIPKISNQARPI